MTITGLYWSVNKFIVDTCIATDYAGSCFQCHFWAEFVPIPNGKSVHIFLRSKQSETPQSIINIQRSGSFKDDYFWFPEFQKWLIYCKFYQFYWTMVPNKIDWKIPLAYQWQLYKNHYVPNMLQICNKFSQFLTWDLDRM